MFAFLGWWAAIQLFGLAALPLTRRVFARLPDRGYAFSKIVGLLLVSYLVWLGASAGAWENNLVGILIALLLTAGLGAALSARRGKQKLGTRLRQYWQAEWRQILAVEALFLLAFAGWALVRAYAPDKILFMSGEKFMEISFLNGVLNSPHFPPLDPWLSGYGISYYYFGYVMMGVMTRVTSVIPTVGFDLYDALLFGLTATGAYGVVANLVQASGGSRRAAGWAGLLGALFVGGMGNLEGLLEGLYASRSLPAAFWTWINIPGLAGSLQAGSFYPGYNWWWWRASRVVVDLNLADRPSAVQPIDEFPFFSFLLGDNHPHKLALPFVLLAVALALNLFLRAFQRSAPEGVESTGTGWRGWVRGGTPGLYLFAALALGGLAFLNTWDFPIYLGLVLLADALGQFLARRRFSPRHTALRLLALGIGLGSGALLLYGFFYTSFASQAGGVLPYVFQPTRLSQYLVMFGPFVFILAFFILRAARPAGAPFPMRAFFSAWTWIAGLTYGIYLLALLAGVIVIASPSSPLGAYMNAIFGDLTIGQGIVKILVDRLTEPWLFLLLSGLLALATTALLRRPHAQPDESPNPNVQPMVERFTLLLAFAGLGLTLVVEFFYLRDNFGARMNTVFKFYYQAWIMLACASAYSMWWVSRCTRGAARGIFLSGTALLLSAGLVYPLMGIYSRTDGFTQPATLDAATTYAGLYPASDTNAWVAHPDDWAAIQWLRANGKLPDGSVPTILEAGSRGYENAGRISAFTGFPTLLGWTNHEGQWRGTQQQINARTPVIQTIFTSYDGQQTLAMLRTWNVRYVIIGDAERDYVAALCQEPARGCSTPRALAKFSQLLTPVFSHGSTTIYRVPASNQP